MWVAYFPFSISSWVCPKISRKRGRKIIIRRSHNNNEGIAIRKAYFMVHCLPDTVVMTNKMLLNFDKILYFSSEAPAMALIHTSMVPEYAPYSTEHAGIKMLAL